MLDSHQMSFSRDPRDDLRRDLPLVLVVEAVVFVRVDDDGVAAGVLEAQRRGKFHSGLEVPAIAHVDGERGVDLRELDDDVAVPVVHARHAGFGFIADLQADDAHNVAQEDLVRDIFETAGGEVFVLLGAPKVGAVGGCAALGVARLAIPLLFEVKSSQASQK